MQPHQERVVEEKKELDSKLNRLKDFIQTSPQFEKLPLDEQERLTSQERVMSEYSNILQARIDAFKE